MGDQDHDGVAGSALDRRQGAAGPRRDQVAHRPRALGQVVLSPFFELGDRAQPARLGEVAALRKDHQRVPWADPAGELADRVDHLGPATLARRDEPRRQAVEDHVDHRLPLQRVLEHDPRPPVLLDEEVVDQEERVAGAGVAAENQPRRPIGSLQRLDPQIDPEIEAASVPALPQRRTNPRRCCSGPVIATRFSSIFS